MTDRLQIAPANAGEEVPNETLMRRFCESLAAFSNAAPALGVDESAMARVHDLTAGLSPGAIEILRLRFVNGLSLTEIGWQLQCSFDAAKKRLQRLVKRLQV